MSQRPVPRRDVLAWSGAALLTPARAENWVNGVHYLRLPQPIPGPPGKVEVVEFFWYACGACNAFEPALQAWVKKLPSWVAFRHQHVFLREASRPHQRLFFTLQAMGVESRYRRAIFSALHQRKLRLDTLEQMLNLLEPLGIDSAKFRATWASLNQGSFQASRIEMLNKQTRDAYQVPGVPALAIGGVYLTTPVDASERKPENPVGTAVLRLADHLLSTLRTP